MVFLVEAANGKSLQGRDRHSSDIDEFYAAAAVVSTLSRHRVERRSANGNNKGPVINSGDNVRNNNVKSFTTTSGTASVSRL